MKGLTTVKRNPTSYTKGMAPTDLFWQGRYIGYVCPLGAGGYSLRFANGTYYHATIYGKDKAVKALKRLAVDSILSVPAERKDAF